MRGKTILTLLVLAGLSIACNQAHQKITKLEMQVSGLEELVGELTLSVAKLATDNATLLEQKHAMVLGNPELREALRLWAAMPEVCNRLPFAVIIPTGDQGCARAIRASANKQPFPSGKLEISIMRDPAGAIVVARQFFSERCELLSDGATRPDVCI